MLEVRSIAIERIHVPPRLRELEEDHARAIALSIKAHGLINPITLRYAPAKNKGATPYILIAGRHRLRAIEINGGTEIEAAIIEADQTDAQLVEISENLFRNELSALDRAVFVASYRDIWEAKFGRIGRGGDRRSKDQVDPLIVVHDTQSHTTNSTALLECPIETIGKRVDTGFSEHLAKRMGVSAPAIKRLTMISQRLSPDVRAAVRGTPAADNQSLLLAVAKRPPSEQRAIVTTMTSYKLDLPTVLKSIKPAKAKPDPQAEALAALQAAWKRADETTRQTFLAEVQAREAAE